MSKEIDRDRAVEESGDQIAVFGRRGAHTFNREEASRFFGRMERRSPSQRSCGCVTSGHSLRQGTIPEASRKDVRLVKYMTGYTNFLARSFGAWVCFDRWSCRSSLTSRHVTYAN
jgi:hypothetical protein